MSQSTDAEEPGVLRKAYRTVTPSYRGRSDVEMDVIGWGYFLILVLLLLPLLPFLLVVWAVTKVLEAVDPRE